MLHKIFLNIRRIGDQGEKGRNSGKDARWFLELELYRKTEAKVLSVN